MNRRTFLQLGGALPLLAGQKPPNIVVVLADDVGYGDFGCYGARKVATPNVDRLAARGVRFTDAHCSSATCTPTRYSLMTGEYSFRKSGTGILPGDAALIIDPRRATLPSVLKQAGYTTGCVGKWHLGLGTQAPDWNAEIKPGPLEVGFDYSFIIPATGDRVPCVYVENHRVVGLDPKDPIRVSYKDRVGTEPTGKDRPDLLRVKPSRGHADTIVNGISRIGFMSGGKAARWVDEDIAKTITGKAVSFVERNAAKPFFLYFATHDIHVPRVPNQQFRGTTGCGIRCDAIAEFDWSVGRIVETLERLKLADNTLLIVTSDNGPVLDNGYADGSEEDVNGHVPAGPLRGGKGSIYEGGTRIPFVAHWPARIRPKTSNALIGQMDLMASLAALTGGRVPEGSGPDSVNVLPALLGESNVGRDHLVEYANALAIRKGQWKLIPADRTRGIATGNRATQRPGRTWDPELYDLSADLGETKNLAPQRPEIVKELTALLDRVRERT